MTGRLAPFAGRPVRLGLRMELLRLAAFGAPEALSAVVTQTEPAGPDLVVFATAGGSVELCCRAEPGTRVRPGDRVGLAVVPDHLHFFDPATGNSLGAGGVAE